MNQKQSKFEVVIAIGIFMTVIAFLISGFVGLIFKEPNNCWDKYTTEQQAIINCEGVTND